MAPQQKYKIKNISNEKQYFNNHSPDNIPILIKTFFISITIFVPLLTKLNAFNLSNDNTNTYFRYIYNCFSEYCNVFALCKINLWVSIIGKLLPPRGLNEQWLGIMYQRECWNQTFTVACKNKLNYALYWAKTCPIPSPEISINPFNRKVTY